METPSIYDDTYFINEEKSAEEIAIDNWLPITSSRTAKWWYSAFHNVTAVVGAGVLAFPYAMSALGWRPGVTILILSWLITLFTLWQMVEMHGMNGRRFDKYHELGQRAFEIAQISLWLTQSWGTNNYSPFNFMGKKRDTGILALLHYRLGSAIQNKGEQPDVHYTYKSKTTVTTADAVSKFFSALGVIAFAYAGHNVVLEIQATIPSTPEKLSKGPMMRGVFVAYIVVAMCYFLLAIIGYWVFGNSVQENILFSLENPKWLIAMANMFVVFHLIGSYQLLGFFGGFASAPTTYFLPCIMWLSIYKPRKFTLSWWLNWILIIVGVLLMIIAPIGGLKLIIDRVKPYKFYSE